MLSFFSLDPSDGPTEQRTNIAIPRATSVGWLKNFTRLVSAIHVKKIIALKQSRQPGTEGVNHASEMARA